MTVKRILAAVFIALGLTAAGTAVAASGHTSATAATLSSFYHT